MKARPMTRREMIENCIVKGTLLAGAATVSQTKLLGAWQAGEQAMRPTPTEVLGPFFKRGAPNVQVLRQPGDPGFPLQVTGQVWNTRGEVIPDARVEVWQADFFGAYDLEGYRYRANVRPGPDGRYAIETIVPGHYDARPAQHIHYLVTAPGHRALITQAYFATDPFFDGDPDKYFAKGGVVQNRELVRPVTLYESATGGVAKITFDLVLEGA